MREIHRGPSRDNDTDDYPKEVDFVRDANPENKRGDEKEDRKSDAKRVIKKGFLHGKRPGCLAEE